MLRFNYHVLYVTVGTFNIMIIILFLNTIIRNNKDLRYGLPCYHYYLIDLIYKENDHHVDARSTRDIHGGKHVNMLVYNSSITSHPSYARKEQVRNICI